MSSKKLMTSISAVAVLALLSQPASEPNADHALATTNAIAVNANGNDTAPSPDFDGDRRVGFSDFLIFAEHFGTRQGDGQYDAQFDLDGDGETGFSDFIAFASQFGTTVGPPPPSGTPDLIVESPSVNDNTMTTGQSFTLRATVRNQGSASSGSTTLRYYRSSDATISTDDVEVGTDGVSSLSAGGTSAESISLNAPSGAGTYFYGACVDNVSGESNTGNNCSSGVSVTVSGGGGGASNLGACRAGLVVRPDQRCTVSGGAFRNIGGGCFNYTPFGTGRFCSGSFNLNGLQGTRVGNDFRITAVP